MPEPERRLNGGRDRVGLVLAVGLALALNVAAFAVLYDVITGEGVLGEHAAQVLTTGFAGVAALLGSYLGTRIARSRD